MMHLDTSRAAPRGTLAAAGALAALVLLAGCFGGGDQRSSGKLSLNIAPLLQQMGAGQTTQSAGTRTGMVAGPPASPVVTPVLTLVVGAIVIDFQDTPIGPNTAITDSLKTSLKNAAVNSAQFLQMVSLPTASATVDFDAPPPGSTHWQIVAVGLRDSPGSLDQIGDNSPIYYGFNTDAAGAPVFLSSDTVGSAPITITMRRACLVKLPPAGCAQIQTDNSFVVTPDLEIVGVYDAAAPTVNLMILPTGSKPMIVRAGGLGTKASCLTPTGCNVTGALIQMAAIVTTPFLPGTTAQVDTTHSESGAYSGTCNPTAINLSQGASVGGCTIETYTTSF